MGREMNFKATIQAANHAISIDLEQDHIPYTISCNAKPDASCRVAYRKLFDENAGCIISRLGLEENLYSLARADGSFIPIPVHWPFSEAEHGHDDWGYFDVCKKCDSPCDKHKYSYLCKCCRKSLVKKSQAHQKINVANLLDLEAELKNINEALTLLTNTVKDASSRVNSVHFYINTRRRTFELVDAAREHSR